MIFHLKALQSVADKNNQGDRFVQKWSRIIQKLEK